ncbi:MAG TPA: cupin domain-containing protein [Candidatus Nanoarchaeia archaeon]|nr:cupin domain-containing protein [Candidatus Nanoarchaeia archaeon]
MNIQNVYSLPSVNNICNQTLREVISLPRVSLAHVTMNPGNVSLLHEHRKTSEIYIVLSGEGVLHYGNKKIRASKRMSIVIPPRTPHQLLNTGPVDLEHLVLAIPPFDQNDVYLIEGNLETKESEVQDEKLSRGSQMALDGAMVYELLSATEKNNLGIGLAVGFLPPKRNATLHFHRISQEIYYILAGSGRVVLDKEIGEVQKGSIISVPPLAIHGLQNTSDGEMEVLCISSPPYTDKDFILAG